MRPLRIAAAVSRVSFATVFATVFAAGAGCDDGGPGPQDSGADAACEVGSGGGASLTTAVRLPTIDDCDGSGRSVSGTLAGPTDAAWFVFRGSDTVGCAVDATVSTRTSGLRLCVFARCATGATTYKGCRDGEKTVLGADTGCCGVDLVSLQHACGGTSGGTTDDTADVYVRVEAPSATACLPYSVGYHY